MREPGALGTGGTRRRDVDHADAMALGVEESREKPTHTAATDDDYVHLVSS